MKCQLFWRIKIRPKFGSIVDEQRLPGPFSVQFSAFSQLLQYQTSCAFNPNPIYRLDPR